MPISGYEEPGVKPLARHSSGCVAGVPIKKRRFVLVQPSSPPSQTCTSPLVGFDVPEKEKSWEESSPSNAGGSKEAFCVAGTEKSYSLEDKSGSSVDKNVRLVKSNIDAPPILGLGKPNLTIGNVSFGETDSKGKLVLAPILGLGLPNLTIANVSLGETDSKEKLGLAHESPISLTPQHTELKFATSEALAPQIEEVRSSKRKLKTEDKCDPSRIQRSNELFVASKEPLVPTSVGQNSDKGHCQEQENVVPYRWNLSFGKERGNVHTRGNDSELKLEGTHLSANRSNWDLNKMMDSWEGSMNEEVTASDAAAVDGLNAVQVQDVKPVISSTNIVDREPKGSGFTLGNHLFGESERRSRFPSFSIPLIQQYTSEDLLHLRLSPSCLRSNINQGESSLSTRVDLGSVQPNISLAATLVSPSSSLDMVGCKTVKSEPLEDGSIAKSSPLKLVDSRTVKSELVEGHGHEALKFSSIDSLKLVDRRTINSESVQEGNEQTLKIADRLSQPSELPGCAAEAPVVRDIVQSFEDQAANNALPITGRESLCSGCRISATMLSISGEVSGHSEICTCSKEVHVDKAPQKVCEGAEQSTSDYLSESACPNGEGSRVTDAVIDTLGAAGLAGGHLDSSLFKSLDEAHIDSFGNGDREAESDEEKINLSTDMLEDSYDLDSESDGNHTAGAVTNKENKQPGGEDDDYEDGEVREPLVHAVMGGSMCKEIQEQPPANPVESDNWKIDLSGSCVDDCFAAKSNVKDSDTIVEGLSETKNANRGGECDNIMSSEKNDPDLVKDASEREPPPVKTPPTGLGKKIPIKSARQKPVDRAGREQGRKVHETDLSSESIVGARQGTIEVECQDKQENAKGTDQASVSPKVEASVSGDIAIKDVNNKGSRSRIINLPRASDGSSLNCARSIQGRSLPSQIERERFTVVGFREDKLHPRGSRHESYMDGPRKFERARNQDQPGRKFGMEFTRGRGKADSQLDNNLHCDWDSGRHFDPELHDGATSFHFRRPKHTAAASPVRLECNGYIIAPDGTLVGAGMRGRKPVNDELPSFHHPQSRRRSPVGRGGGPVTRGRMVRRPIRNMSPGRCIGEDGPDLVGMRHEEKFRRNFPNEMMDHMFSRHQPQYERAENHFGRGDRSFSPIRRRGLPHVSRICSRSPPRSRTRSPVPWSSPRRRSMDGFDGHPDLAHRRSPVMYREEQMRSPRQRLCFREDMVARRHGSPPYMSQLSDDEMREMGSGREHDHPRSFIPNRSPPDMVLPRNRRFDMIDPRERTESDEYMDDVPMHSGRFHELGDREGVNERRKCNERRGPVRSFRPPPYNGAEVEDFHFHGEDGPTRPYRFCPETDREFRGRGSIRERDFDRRIKNRPGNVPKRMRSTEEQEENFNHGGRGWHDSGFNDASRVNSRRF